MCKKISGIYKIEDIKTGAVYVGSADSDNGIKKRWSCHLAHLRKDKHKYKELQDAFNQDENRIRWEILEQCKDYELEERENYWIKYCGMIEGWTVINKQKKAIRKGKAKDKSKMIKAQTGENNGHNTKLSKKDVFDILNLMQSEVDRKIIAEKYNIYPSYISRIGKDRWVQTYKEWEKQKELSTALVCASATATCC